MLGLWIPKHPICLGHCSPYEHLRARYFEIYRRTIALACRGGGKSYNLGLECWLKGRFKKNWGAVILGGSKMQSEKSYFATNDFWDKTEALDSRDVLKSEPTMSSTKFKTGSWYRISTASTKSTHGDHQPALFLDEIDEMDRPVFNAAMMQPQSMHGHKASWGFTSTRHRPAGLMSEWVDNAEVRGYKLFTWCILEVLEACDDYRCDTCGLDEYCQGRMKPVIEEARQEQFARGMIGKGDSPVMGFNTVEDAIAKVQTAMGNVIDPNAQVIDVEADLFCRKPSREGLVYKEYDTNTHGVANMKMLNSASEVRDEKIGEYVLSTWRRVRCIDFGTTNPMVCLDCFIDPMDRLYIWDEIYKTGITINDLVAMLTKDVYYDLTAVDPAGGGDTKVLNKAGISTVFYVHRVRDGVTLVTNQLKPRLDGTVGLYVNRAKCPYTHWEFTGYRYPDKGVNENENPLKLNDHAMDGIRNLIAVLRRGPTRQSKGRFG